MTNPEKLGLYLGIKNIERFIYGNNLKENIINRMPRLTGFIFDICSVISINNEMNMQIFTKSNTQFHKRCHTNQLYKINEIDFFPYPKFSDSSPHTKIH